MLSILLSVFPSISALLVPPLPSLAYQQEVMEVGGGVSWQSNC